MVKFIIEVEEEYIRKYASAKSVSDSVKAGTDPLKGLFQLIAFSSVEKELDKGINEFIIQQDKLDKTEKKMFEMAIDNICLIAGTQNKKEKEDNKPEGAE